MSKTLKNNKDIPKILIEDLVVGGVYQTYVSDIVKILSINEKKKEIKFYNVTGAFNQWRNFKNIYLIKKIIP